MTIHQVGHFHLITLDGKHLCLPFKCLIPFHKVSIGAMVEALFIGKHLLPGPFFLESVYTQQLQ